MKIKTYELTGPALDWAVGTALKLPAPYWSEGNCARFSTDWAQGGPIIEREKISVTSQTNGHSWAAKGAHNYSYGPTPLIAAMRCYVVSKLGNTIDIPEELL